MNRGERRRLAAIERELPARSKGRLAAVGQTIVASAFAGALAVVTPNVGYGQIVVPPSNGPCVVAATVATCTGNVSAGVDANGPTINTLNVNSLTQNLGGSASRAIDFSTVNNSVTINLDLGTFNAIGTVMGTVDGSGDVVITSRGDVIGGGDGAIVGVVGDKGTVSIQSTGNIRVSLPPYMFGPRPPTREFGILGGVTNGGNVRILSIGDIRVEGGGAATGIEANGFLRGNGAGTISIVSNGNILASSPLTSTGISASHDTGPISITSNGQINADDGIQARARISGDVTIASTGNIWSQQTAVRASTGSGTASVSVISGIVSGRTGISVGAASTNPSSISVFSDGEVRSNGQPSFSRAIDIAGSPTNIMIAGTVTGGNDGAIQFAPGVFNDRLELHPGFSITGTVFADAGIDTLQFGGAGSGSFDLGAIDTGANTQQYQGFETFQVIGGDWTFSGATMLPFTVTGGIVMGNAGFGDLTLNDGATIAPGNSIGKINVAGNVTFNTGSTYQVELNALGQSDMIEATGTVTVAGTGTTLDVVAETGVYPETSPTYTILTATNGVTGQFASITDNLPDLDFEAIYNATNVQLAYTVTASGNTSPKEIHPSALGGAMDAAHLFGETLRRRGGLVASGGFSGLGNGETVSLGYMAGSTAVGSSASFAGVTGSGPETLPPHVLAADMPHMPTESHEPRQWAVWGAGLGSVTDVYADGAVPGWDAATGGVAFGFERRVNPFDTPSVIGVAFGFTSSDVDSGASDADIEGYHLGLYAAASSGPLTLSGAISYAFQDYDFARVIPLGGGTVTALGSADGHALTGAFEAFYDLAEHSGRTNVSFGPLVTLDTVYAERDSFAETGAGILNLTVGGDDTSQLVTGLGVVAGLTRAVGTTLVTLDGRVAWEHVFGDRNVTSTSTIPVAGATFVTPSAATDRDRIAVGLGAALEMSDTVSAHIRYDGAYSGSTTDHQGSAGVTIRF